MDSLRVIRSRNLCELTRQGFSIDEALELQRISHSLHTLDENECNYGLTHRQETRQTNLEKKANEIAISHKLNAYHQGDPRGWSLYIIHTGEEDYTKGIAVCPH
jgi:hypothetical protein